MSDWEALGLIALAGVLGAILGFEREIKEKAAGIRTHLLVSTAASLFFAATVGIAVAVEELVIAIGMTALALIALAGLPLPMRTIMRSAGPQ
jgi:putative Mg2+ transporter-C (MgtC) family protein